MRNINKISHLDIRIFLLKFGCLLAVCSYIPSITYAYLITHCNETQMIAIFLVCIQTKRKKQIIFFFK